MSWSTPLFCRLKTDVAAIDPHSTPPDDFPFFRNILNYVQVSLFWRNASSQYTDLDGEET